MYTIIFEWVSILYKNKEENKRKLELFEYTPGIIKKLLPGSYCIYILNSRRFQVNQKLGCSASYL